MNPQSIGHNILGLASSAGITALIDHVAGGFGPVLAVAVTAVLHTLFTLFNNWLSAKGVSLPVVTKVENLIDGAVAKSLPAQGSAPSK